MLYADLRAKVDDGKGRTLPVTARTLETIIRLSSAHAKAHLRNLVTVDGADANPDAQPQPLSLSLTPTLPLGPQTLTLP